MVLFISNKDFLASQNTGGKQCSKRNYELVKNIWGNENVSLLMLSNENKDGNEVIQLSSNNISKYVNMLFLRDGYSYKSEKKIKKYIKILNPDIVFFDGSSFGYLAKFLHKKVKKIVFYHNIEKRYASSRILKQNLICIIKFFSFWLNEKYITQKADLRICLNQRDNELLYKNYNVKADYLLPITFTDIGEEHIYNSKNKTGNILFVGSNFMPNVLGITWFCKNVMPTINKKLFIVGKGMEKLTDKLTSDNVKVIGTVENLNEYYDNADAVIMPIFVGDGMKVKTAEALMHGKTIFATDEALEGYEVNNIKGINRCNTSEEFVFKLQNEDCYGNSREIRKIFCDKYNTETVQSEFKEFILQLYQFTST